MVRIAISIISTLLLAGVLAPNLRAIGPLGSKAARNKTGASAVALPYSSRAARSGHYLPGRRGWIKTKNRADWRYPLEARAAVLIEQ